MNLFHRPQPELQRIASAVGVPPHCDATLCYPCRGRPLVMVCPRGTDWTVYNGIDGAECEHLAGAVYQRRMNAPDAMRPQHFDRPHSLKTLARHDNGRLDP